MKLYYKTINGVRYVRDLVEAADAFTAGRGEGRLSLDEIQAIYRMAADGRRITDTERRTLIYISDNYQFTDKAIEWLDARLRQDGADNAPALEKSIRRIVQGEYGLSNMAWQIDTSAVEYIQRAKPARLFEEALRGALEAFLRWGQGQLSFFAFVSRRDLAMAGHSNPEALLKSYLDRCMLFLIPESAEARSALGFDLPERLDSTNFWLFGLLSPDFSPALFTAYVHREQKFQYSKGYFSRHIALGKLIPAIVHQYAGLATLQVKIDPLEVERQLAIMPGQNFGNALFSAVHTAIYNGESSFSFRDMILQEVWPDPDIAPREYLKAYLEAGTLYLIPLDYRERTDAGSASFPVPESYTPWLEGEWLFGLEIQGKTHVRFFINTPRENNDGDSGWNEGFVPVDPLPFYARLRRVADIEFEMSGLELRISEADYEEQRTRFGPDWRHMPGLLRQALNTTLHDYLTPMSVFYIVSQVHRHEVDPNDFDDPQEYRAAIRFMIHRYLESGVLEFLSIDVPGALVQDNWLFSLGLPRLSDHRYYIVIPRWPDEGQLPYVYGEN